MGAIENLSNHVTDITLSPLETDPQKRDKAQPVPEGGNAPASSGLLHNDNVDISDSGKVASTLLAEPAEVDQPGHSKTDGFNLPQQLRLNGTAAVGFDLKKHPDREIAWLNYKIQEVLAKNADIMERAVSGEDNMEQLQLSKNQG